MTPSAPFIRLLILVTSIKTLYAARIFNRGEIHPAGKDEISTCGNIRDVIQRNSARFRKILVRNTNSEIVFLNDDSRRMTARAKSKLDVLATRVSARWGGRKVKVLKAWTDTVVPGTISLHYEGRAVRLVVDDNDVGKLGELAGLAEQAGFDWIQYTRNNYVHASVIRDVCQTSIDLAFILDTSGSVGSYNFGKIKTFVKNIIDFFNIGTTGTHVAVVTYSSWPVVEFNLKAHYSKTSLKNAVGEIEYRAGWTYTGDALEMTRTDIFNTVDGMRPDKGIPKVAVLLTDGYSNGWGVKTAANALKNQGVNLFCIGVGNYNERELNDIATDPDSTHVFTLDNFNDLSSWVDKLSSVSCDEGATVSSCDDTTSSVEGGSFLYFKTKFESVTGGISVEVKDIEGISHLYVSLTTTNPGPMDPHSQKNELNTSPRSIRLNFTSARSSTTIIYVAVQGQMNSNKFKLSMWDTLFSQDSYVANPDEEVPGTQKVKTVASSFTKYRLRYSITDGNSEGKFHINSQTGLITADTLDREATATYRITVLAQNINKACHKGRTVVVVNVQDTNDNSPQFSKKLYQADVKENARIGTSITTVTAADNDKDDMLTYRINDTSNTFSIDDTNGVVTTTKQLDFETNNLYRIEIRASDGKNEAKTILEIRILSVNERPSLNDACAKSSRCSFRVNESKKVNTYIGTLNASDPDGDRLTYKLKMLDSQDNVFAIDTTGRITLGKKLDREVKPVYSVLVTVSDDGTPVLATQTVVSVIVTDYNDNYPTFPYKRYTASVYENAARDSTVMQVVAIDADIGDNSKLTYSLQGGNTSFFTIDSNTGIIKTSQTFDRETKSSYQLTIRVVDGGNPQHHGQTSVTVNILDVNDNKPNFIKNAYSFSVSENTTTGATIATLSATDLDIGINADIRYYIVSGNLGNTFDLESQTGNLKLANTLDCERRTLYRLVIGVSDRGLPSLSSTTNVQINVVDVNDNSPIFASSVYRATVKENSLVGKSVVKVLATDRDSGANGKVEYAIIDGNTENTFTIDLNSGLITIKKSPKFKTSSRYDLKVEARDKGNPIKTDTTQVKITIEDVNDNKPIFGQDRYNVKVSEAAAIGSTVQDVSATDEDSGPLGRVVFSILRGNVGNKFTIDGSTGSIKVSSSLDRESTKEFILTIKARDGGTPPLSSTCQVLINVTDVNDNTPVFSGPYTFHVSEDQFVAYLVGQVTATDRDSGENARISYSGSTDVFNIDPVSGKITLSKKVDHEAKSSYSLTVTASDHGSPPMSTSIVVKVIVDDVNDNPPKFPRDMYNCSIAENMVKGATVCYVTAVDPDSSANGRLVYTIAGGNGTFLINSDTGEITTTAPLDRESTASYRLTVTVSDGKTFRSGPSFTDSVTVYVTVQDENDNPPKFIGAPYRMEVKEDASFGTSVGRVSAVDADDGPNGMITYSILQGNSEQKFNINPSSGVISVQKSLDREQTAQYTLSVQAKDSGKPVPQSTSTNIQVVIQDVNDHSPSFEREIFYGQIREDASIGSSVLQVKAVDRDEGANAKLTFSLSGKGSENFTIDSTGFVKSFTALDYETTSSYLLTVTANDSGNPPKQDTAKVNISIINVNDNVPSFDSTGQITTIPEDVAIGTRVVKLNATDSDGSQLTFDIIKGNIGGAFIIGSQTGVISVAKRLDRENVANYTLVVKATDNGGMFVSNNATIQVLDVNDNKPTFEKNSYSVEILENQLAGITVVKVLATDRDLGKNAEITYQISSGDKTKFKIDPTTGLITTLATLDREQQQAYQLYVTAKDHGTPSQSSVALVTVKVKDENDNKPRFAQNLYPVSLVENTALNSVVLRLRAVDPDEGTNGQVTYAITSGNSDNTFGISANTGELSVLRLIDRETIASYDLTVSASDSGSPKKNSSTSVSITVIDENDNAPVFTNQNASFSVEENVPRDTLVGVVTATDADVGSNSQIVYSIIKGAQNVLAINPSTGVITVMGRIDRETMATYPLTIRASDRGSPVLFSDKKFTVRVDDVNDNAPAFEKSIYRVNIREDAPRQSSVVVVKATDADLGANAAVRYQIVSGNTQGLFSINPSSGLITTSGFLDYEKQRKYTLEISASDSARTTNASVIIDVVDVNDNDPLFGQRAYFASVQENNLTEVIRVFATDKDPFGVLVYTLNSSYPSSNRFNIDPTSGSISTAEPLDRETKDKYVIQVVVADGGTPARTDAAIVTINVTDVNDNRPTFNDSSYSVTAPENITVNTIVAQIFASDRDLGNNAKFSYSMLPTRFFSIESDTGIIRNVLTLDRETTPSFTLTCTATDDGYPRLTSEPVTIHVILQDVNDNAPRFENQPYYSNVSENEAVGSIIADVLAVDRDLGDAGKVEYRITSGDQNGMFTIDNNTGIISLGRAHDRERQDAYTLTVQASDLGTPPLQSTTKVYINILDVNDNAPIFNTTSLRGSVKENKPAGTYIMRLTANDADSGYNARIQFRFQTDEYKNLFSLDIYTGEIETRKGLDRERQERYVLKIVALDMGNPRLTSLADVIIDVIDEDDNCPVFQYSEYNVTKSEDIALGAEIVQVLATDVDQENVTYYIRSGNPGGAFTIDQKTGMIKVANPDAVDREKHEAFTLIVRAGSENCGVNETDGGNTAEGGIDILSSAIATVNIILEDVNDNPPTFQESAYTFDFDDIKTKFLFTISAADKDLGPGGIVKYRMAGQTEIGGNHVATVAAYDQGSPSLESNVTVTVHVKSGLTCEAMVFTVTSDGGIYVKTLCHFDEKPDENKIVVVGEPHQLKCSANGNTVPEYRWMLDGRMLTTPSSNGTYVIERLSQENEGSYSCLASSEAGVIQSSASMLIVYEKPTVILHPKNTSAALGGITTLECKATGDPDPSYQWFKNDVEILATNDIVPDKPTLVIRKTIIQDQAWYRCSLRNAAGTTLSNAAYLKIFESEALVSLEISVNKPNLAKQCHIFDLEAFKKTLRKVLEAEATITNMTVLAETLCESDPCFSNPCMNGGVCKTGPGKNEFSCRCEPGWAGKDCTNDINECERSPCRNGTCTNTVGSYQCKCTSYSTGKNCKLRKDACAGSPCNKTNICVLSEMHANGYKCLSGDKLIEMKYTKEIADDGDKFDLEKKMTEIIISAPDKLSVNNSNVNTRRRERSANDKIDYGTCVARIHLVSDTWIKFFLLCPKELNANQDVVKQYVCGLMLDQKVAESCGSGSNMMTPVPPVTYPAIDPMRVKILLFARDKSNRDIDGESLIKGLQSKTFQEQMASQGVEFVAAKQVRPKPLKANPSSSSTGLIIGLAILALMVVAVAIVGFLYYQRRKNQNKQVNIEDRAILRRDSPHQNVQRNVSTRDITRSEKKYINQAFTNSIYDDDGGDEEMFMVEVDLSSPKKKDTPITKLLEEPWYYDKITSIEAEDLLDSKVQPGTFLVRKGLNPNEYVLTVRCPEGGPSHRHLVLKYTSKQKFEVQFGTMPLALDFDTVGDVIDHFQATPIEFGPNVPDVVLTNGWCKSQG
ncbi:protein dachsous-like [Actinia tenebrosa]|uniref:Hedgehog protein n=1 Tax=Actinia tenebrosa TaxID=6105 RepID=A0A6P8I9B2_ACTTE|nr:protein dachsous-like [Actinia tenebrosa]